jgi:hypothetical protein
MTMNLFACAVLLSAIPLAAQNAPVSIALTDKSNVPSEDILKSLKKGCPNVSITNDGTGSDYTLEAVKRGTRQGLRIVVNQSFDLTVFDREGAVFSSVSTDSLGGAVKDTCHAIKTFVMIEVVDTQNLTQSSDVRRDTSGGVVGAIVNSATGRRTQTDSATISVIVKGEHALLDCYEHSTGCATLGPGKYYGGMRGDGIWVNYRMPLTHEPVRSHYKIAGSW